MIVYESFWRAVDDLDLGLWRMYHSPDETFTGLSSTPDRRLRVIAAAVVLSGGCNIYLFLGGQVAAVVAEDWPADRWWPVHVRIPVGRDLVPWLNVPPAPATKAGRLVLKCLVTGKGA